MVRGRGRGRWRFAGCGLDGEGGGVGERRGGGVVGSGWAVALSRVQAGRRAWRTTSTLLRVRGKMVRWIGVHPSSSFMASSALQGSESCGRRPREAGLEASEILRAVDEVLILWVEPRGLG